MADFPSGTGTATRKQFGETPINESSASQEKHADQFEASQMKNPTDQSMPAASATETIDCAAAFAVVEVDRETMSTFAREYSNLANPIPCIADCQMLLEYMVGKERSNGVTVSFHACGVDPVAFDQVAAEAGEGVVPIKVPSKEEPALYEKILVDGVLYLSCLSECLNEGYLHQVISEATEALFVHGTYTYTMVGPRPIGTDGHFMDTLKLNSYEMSVLMAYTDSLGNVKPRHCVENGRATIKFVRE